jgi:hypothetical protein
MCCAALRVRRTRHIEAQEDEQDGNDDARDGRAPRVVVCDDAVRHYMAWGPFDPPAAGSVMVGANVDASGKRGRAC